MVTSLFLIFSLIYQTCIFPLCIIWQGNRIFLFGYKVHSTISFWDKQVCPEFINIIIYNNLSYRSGSKSLLFNVVVKLSLLSLHIFICTSTFCFAAMGHPSATSICLSVSSNKLGTEYETCGVVWHVSPESKIQLVNCTLSPKSLLWH